MNPRAQPFLPAAGPEHPHGQRGAFDIVLVTGDAYVDHPGFGAALIGRLLASQGYRVAILSQPPWDSPEPFRTFGPPRLFFGITSGAVDAAMNRHYSLGARRKRDVYSPKGLPGRRPPHPLVTYANRARQAFPNVPIVLGGLEASLKRLVHFDFLSGRMKRPVLQDAKADLLVFGMAENQVIEIARRLGAGEPIEGLTDIPGTSYRLATGQSPPEGALRLPGFAAQESDPSLRIEAHLQYEREGLLKGNPVVQDADPGTVVVLSPAPPLETEALDRIYALPFQRDAHPMYGKEEIPALTPVRFSVVTHRGCFGGCAFCSLFAHQGRHVVSRSPGGILAEVESFRRWDTFPGAVPDVGGPTANMYGVECGKPGPCRRPSCLYPAPCRHLTDADPLMGLLEALAALPDLRLRIASGVRHDLALRQEGYIDLLASRFTGGQLKVAPEHKSPEVLRRMRKPAFDRFEDFEARFQRASRRAGKTQYLVPYFISGHPGCTMAQAIELTDYLVKRGWKVRQVQDYTPIPLTLSAAMMASGLDEKKNSIPVPRGAEKHDQLALLRYHVKRTRSRLRRVLRAAGRGGLLRRIEAQDRRKKGKRGSGT
ncbi:MAG: YgiQ family radical SAM protein [Planctomycetota bacterium]|jgi:uncharacterized radical SAM protein YgiQ